MVFIYSFVPSSCSLFFQEKGPAAAAGGDEGTGSAIGPDRDKAGTSSKSTAQFTPEELQGILEVESKQNNGLELYGIIQKTCCFFCFGLYIHSVQYMFHFFPPFVLLYIIF